MQIRQSLSPHAGVNIKHWLSVKYFEYIVSQLREQAGSHSLGHEMTEEETRVGEPFDDVRCSPKD